MVPETWSGFAISLLYKSIPFLSKVLPVISRSFLTLVLLLLIFEKTFPNKGVEARSFAKIGKSWTASFANQSHKDRGLYDT